MNRAPTPFRVPAKAGICLFTAWGFSPVDFAGHISLRRRLTPPSIKEYNESIRGVAQLVARKVWDFEAAGSSPVTPTIEHQMTTN